MTYQSVNPYDGRIVKTFQIMSDVELKAAIAAADACFESWRSTTFAQRATTGSRAAAILRERVDEFARLATLEMGKLIGEARGEVLLAAASRFTKAYYTSAIHSLCKIPPGTTWC